MRYIADLHIHSRFSRATSKACTIPGLAAWARIKGIDVVGTGDFTHPGWFSHFSGTLTEAEPGFFRLKPGVEPDFSTFPHFSITPMERDVRFVLTAEISSIYKRGGRVRKIHNVLLVPDFDSVRRLNARLAGIGNIESDGRPILGLDSRDLLEILLEEAPEGFLVPAHVWTPWFSLFGSRSGFDSIEECFGDLSDHIFALETGLSSDPDMNRLISALDRCTLISNSDCHSPGKLGREANIFNTDFDFFAMRRAIRSPQDQGGKQVFEATIEFFPEEGKYHCDGHRKCGFCCEPLKTRELAGTCPRCGKALTVGVLHRVMELADRSRPVYPPGSPGVFSIVPLPELISELVSVGPASKKVTKIYSNLVSVFGSEFTLLLETPPAEIEKRSPLLAEAVSRIRSGRVIRNPGYDGEFGTIKVFADNERQQLAGQLELFQAPSSPPRRRKNKPRRIQPRLFAPSGRGRPDKGRGDREKKLNEEQQSIVHSRARHLIVKAGPGTGKTFTLVARLRRILGQGAPCTVITFTNRAADELKERIGQWEGRRLFIGTFHGFCLHHLRQTLPRLQVAGPGERRLILRRLHPRSGEPEIRAMGDDVGAALIGDRKEKPSCFQAYMDELDRRQMVDIDAVVPMLTAHLQKNDSRSNLIRERTGFLFIDEFQDLNRSQYHLVRTLAATSSVFAIGDPDQAIYGFRGSDPAYFYHFLRDLDPACFSLVRNYRSAQQIIEAANGLISCNGNRGDDENFGRPRAVRSSRGALFRHRASGGEAEARFIVREVERLVGGTSHREIERLDNGDQDDAGRQRNITFGDIAVLYRTGGQAGTVAAAMEEQGIPHQVVDLRPYYRQGAAKHLYLRLLAAADDADLPSLLELLAEQAGIGGTTVDYLERNLTPSQERGGRDFLAAALALLAAKERFSPQRRIIRQLENELEELRRSVLDAGLRKALEAECRDREEDDGVRRLLELADSFGTGLGEFVRHLRRYSDTVVYDRRAEAVTLMTLHASKGLEFPVVFICGLAEGILPHQGAAATGEKDKGGNDRDIEEERRLFYVGMTRAIDTLYLTSAAVGVRFGRVVRLKESRFLQEIPLPLFQNPRQSSQEKKPRKKKKKDVRQLTLF